MADLRAQQIVAAALTERQLRPGGKALIVLDAAMRHHSRTSPDFEVAGAPFETWIHPPSPFAELLRDAFAPEIEAADVELWDDGDAEVRDTFRQLWARAVVKRFAVRYHLWGR